MADEPRYSDELRIPISITLPWSGRRTPAGRPWPKNAQGRDWSSRRSEPVFPIDQLPHGSAPGTSPIYKAETERVAALQRGASAIITTVRAMPAGMALVTVEGAETSIALSALPAFLLALAVGASVELVIGSDRYRFTNTPAIQPWAKKMAGALPNNQTLPVPDPLPPMPPLVAETQANTHTGNTDPAVRLPAPPGVSVSPSSDPVLPGAEIKELSATVFAAKPTRVEAEKRLAVVHGKHLPSDAAAEVQSVPPKQWTSSQPMPGAEERVLRRPGQGMDTS